MKIDQIFKKLFNPQIAQKAKDLYESNSINSIDILKTGKQNCFYVFAKIDEDLRLLSCNFTIDLERLAIANMNCSCSNNRLCEHIAAVLLWMMENDCAAIPFHYVRPIELRRMSNYELFMKKIEEERLEHNRSFARKLIEDSQANFENMVAIETHDKLYTLIPEFKAEDQMLLMGLSISDGQNSYVIKNYQTLIKQVNKQEFNRYGKKMGFVHDLRFFNQSSRKMIEFLEKIPQDNNAQDRYNDKRYVLLSGDNLDRFINEFNKTAIFFPFVNDKIALILEKEDSDYLLSLANYDKEYYFGNNNMLIGYDNQLHQLKGCNASLTNLMNTLINRVTDKLYIAEKDFNAFYKHIIKANLSKLLFVEGRNYLPAKLDEELSLIKLEGDVVDNNIVFKISAFNEAGQTIDIFNDERYKNDEKRQIVLAIFKAKEAKIDETKNEIALDLNNSATQEFLAFSIINLGRYADIYVSENLKKYNSKSRYRIKAGVRFNNGLLELNLDSKDIDVDELSDILKAYRQKKRFFKLKNGETIHIESDDFAELDKLFNDFNIDLKNLKDGKANIDTYRSLNLDSYLDKMEHLQINEEASLKEYIEGFKQQKNIVPIKEKYQNILRDYQKYGVNWLLTLYSYNLNGILADEMGLGKTLEVITLLDSIQEKGRHSLVVCPASLIYNWQSEIGRFSDDLKVLMITGNKKERQALIEQYLDYDVLVTSYDYIRRDIEDYQEIAFEYVILDEAQNIKNQKTQNAESVKALKAKHRLALSGTPIENSLAELWSIFDFLMPNYLYSYNYFKNNFEVPIAVENDDERMQDLKLMISPFILRRVKKDVLKELPNKVDHEYLIDFNEEEKKLYLANLASINKTMQSQMGDKVDHIAVLAMLTRLRQICCDARLVYDDVKTPSSKVEACIDLVGNMIENNKKVLIFSAFTSLIDLLIEELNKRGIKYYKLTGQTPKEERQQLVDQYQASDDVPVFLISLKAGGTGLNLTTAEAVIHIDPWWNISAQNQATDRAHRIGQNANVQVYRLIMKDSIEEKITKMQARKQALADNFVEGNDGSLANMSKDEIMSLFER